MDKAEVERIVMAMQFRARPKGEKATGEHSLEEWLGSYHKHRYDAAKHSAGGIGEARALEIAQAEDKKLKVTK